MRNLLLLCIAFLGITFTASAVEVVKTDAAEKYSVDNFDSLDIVITVPNASVSAGVLADTPSLLADLGTANDKGFIGFDLIMDTREHPRIRDDLVCTIHETMRSYLVQSVNPHIRSPVDK